MSITYWVFHAGAPEACHCQVPAGHCYIRVYTDR
jgi:hypothetical protein